MAKKIELTTPMMRGEDIKALQTPLTPGYNAGDPDGIAGKNTVAAIQRFAQAHSMGAGRAAGRAAGIRVR